MRKISLAEQLFFGFLLLLIIVLTILTTTLLLDKLPLGDFRSVILIMAGIILLFFYSFIIYRIFLFFMPLTMGEIGKNSKEQFAWHVNILFYLMIFNILIKTNLLPVPIGRLIYLVLGARMGKNSYSGGAILDPPLTIMGENSLVGHNAVLFAHALEGEKLSISTIQIGNNVTIGSMAVIMSDVVIEDNALVSSGAVVIKGTRIKKGEIWGGIPAKFIKLKQSKT